MATNDKGCEKGASGDQLIKNAIPTCNPPMMGGKNDPQSDEQTGVPTRPHKGYKG